MYLKRLKILTVACFFFIQGKSQEIIPSISFFTPADTFHQERFYTALGFSTATYTGFSIALYKTWYQQYPQEGFHLFNDWGEWNNMDKAGHIYTGYFQGVLCYKGAKWTGLSEGKRILTGAICGSLFQSTIEVMDGFSSQWGFSIPDFGANLIGIGAFALQQKKWGEQRIVLKESSFPSSHPDGLIKSNNGMATTTLLARSENLFGSSTAEKYLKDYNNQTYWISTNIASFFPDTPIPPWLNLAVGYGSENLYGGFANEWIENGQAFLLDKDLFPRYRQYYLSLDVDLTRIKTASPFLKTLLSILNVIKVPSPALEVTSGGEVIFHFLKF